MREQIYSINPKFFKKQTTLSLFNLIKNYLPIYTLSFIRGQGKKNAHAHPRLMAMFY